MQDFRINQLVPCWICTPSLVSSSTIPWVDVLSNSSHWYSLPWSKMHLRTISAWKPHYSLRSRFSLSAYRNISFCPIAPSIGKQVLFLHACFQYLSYSIISWPLIGIRLCILPFSSAVLLVSKYSWPFVSSTTWPKETEALEARRASCAWRIRLQTQDCDSPPVTGTSYII